MTNQRIAYRSRTVTRALLVTPAPSRIQSQALVVAETLSLPITHDGGVIAVSRRLVKWSIGTDADTGMMTCHEKKHGGTGQPGTRGARFGLSAGHAGHGRPLAGPGEGVRRPG